MSEGVLDAGCWAHWVFTEAARARMTRSDLYSIVTTLYGVMMESRCMSELVSE